MFLLVFESLKFVSREVNLTKLKLKALFIHRRTFPESRISGLVLVVLYSSSLCLTNLPDEIFYTIKIQILTVV